MTKHVVCSANDWIHLRFVHNEICTHCPRKQSLAREKILLVAPNGKLFSCLSAKGCGKEGTAYICASNKGDTN